LGFRPAGFLPNLQDYQAYEVVRNEFLRSARGRAALLGGGIVARLARDIVNKHDVYDGPTVHALQEGEHALCVWEVGRGRAFWDDQLTSEETDLICGTYEVATGMEGIQQTATRSWWPRPNSWKTCGLNCGYWSKDAKSWFQKRMTNIHNATGSVALMTPQEWHTHLKFQRAYALSTNNDLLAVEYLTKECNLPI
ncbi:hypothetical protein F5876DRAFT_52269, partial [Lentinula aff. lateritia]